MQTIIQTRTLPGRKPHTIATTIVASTVVLVTLRPGAVRAARLEAEQHVADGVVLRIVPATVTQQPGFEIAALLDYRSWINCRQRHRLKQCLGSHQAQYDIGIQPASSSSVVLARAATYCMYATGTRTLWCAGDAHAAAARDYATWVWAGPDFRQDLGKVMYCALARHGFCSASD